MIALLLVSLVGAHAVPMRRDMTATVRAARALVAREGDAVWRGFSTTPLPIDLVDGSRETVFCAPPLRGFRDAGRDPTTRCPMQTRIRQMPVDVGASTEIDGVQVVAMGTPAALSMTRAEWMVTVAHEAFHQYQEALPGYRAAVARVGLARNADGTSGALTYPFPYDRPAVGAAFSRMGNAAAMFLGAPDEQGAQAALRRYVRARKEARAAVSAQDWRYYEFQVGQEGVARWTELRLATDPRAGPAINAVGRDRAGGLAVSLRAIDDQGLALWKRSAFYVFGAIEAQMADRFLADWRDDYRRSPFTMGARLDRAAATKRN